MTKNFNLGGFIVLLVLIAAVSGVGAAWDIISNLATSMWEFLLCLPQLIKPFIPFLGIENMAVSLLIFGIVLMSASGLGIYISRKFKSKLWTGISGGVEFVSTLITIGSVVKM